ncbi:flagellar protein FliS [Pseudomonas sp. ATCC 13867]|uniref:flagellar export chaperone FliS n=1 Tax=Pseudomonas sp. ATCC 13867 TaxID=1294143 RepID=UPI0002C4EC98|nr:flagellar export chaperone FliS [Pseudomonas sp. ATCC 13867]AGI23642.1 flagellar protein FliS [Pseudomonas sp. ATCC 13867]RFQ41580.1 flagella export chaperone FliS [Pseudomonas sp. ATCC 13867]
MYAMRAMKQYQQVSLESRVAESSPHALIQMLMQGGLERMAQARGAIERGQLAERGELISKAIGIVGGLREALNLEQGGELASNLDRLYGYMTERLLEVNRSGNSAILDEVSGLLREVKSGWDAIAA